MFRQEALQELQAQFNEEGGKFTPKILWVDDHGVSEDKLAAFSQAAQAKVTVVNNPNQALVKWQVVTKDQPYNQIGLKFRQMLEGSMTAEGQHPEQLNALDQILPQKP